MPEAKLAFIFVCWLFGFYFFFRPRFPTFKKTDQKNQPVISIVIPARNEEKNIQTLLNSLQRQKTQPLEILVMNDHSTDQTAQFAHKLGASVIDVPELPQDWNGKSFACAVGAKQAKGDYFIFMDADVFFEEDGLQKIIDLIDEKNTVWSICPFHTIQKFYEEFSSIFNVMMVAGTGSCLIGNKQSKLVGQVMLVSRKNYELVGGYESVKNKILENFYLTDVFRHKGISTSTICGKGSVSMRMFPDGFKSLVQSWKKGFVNGATATSLKILIPIILWIAGGFTILFSFHFEMMHVFVFLYLLYVIQIYRMYRTIGNFSFFNALFYPVFFLFFIILFLYSSITKIFGQKTNWKGRSVG